MMTKWHKKYSTCIWYSIAFILWLIASTMSFNDEVEQRHHVERTK